MSISHHIKIIGRGKDGARALNREDAADLMGQLLDGTVTDLEVGAFCLAMRIKGETPEEMAGFLDAAHARLQRLPTTAPTVVLPSYNGARKLPVLTPLLALLLAREGLAVLVHGCETENNRISSQKVLSSLGIKALSAIENIKPGQVAFAPTDLLHPGLKRLLDVRRVVGLRNPAHSLVKLMVPVAGPAVLVSSYTHPEYLQSMTATLALTRTPALLLRGTEGEPVADARRTPAMDAFVAGAVTRVQEAQTGPLAELPDLPGLAPEDTAAWTGRVLEGQAPVPPPVARQVAHIVALTRASFPHPVSTAATPSVHFA
ncbi:MAG: DNA-binding protein YbiB [Burkholderiales bacterium]|nr:DNA-binding protein YbiB [Burkholderiales bacterium]